MTTTRSAAAPRPVKRARPRWPWVLAGLLLLGGLGGGAYYARSRAGQAGTTITAITTATVERGLVRVSVSGPGTLEASATRTVGADLSATVGQVPAVGERVTKGQRLITLQSDTAQDNVGSARLNLQKAQASLDATRAGQASSAAQRLSSVTQAENSVQSAQQAVTEAQRTLSGQEQLYRIGAVSTQALNEARAALSKAQLSLSGAQSSLSAARTQAQTGAASDRENLRNQALAVEQAQASLATAQSALTKLKVYAPISGVVSSVQATEGSVVSSGATLLTLLDDTTLNLPVQIDETEISGVQAGQEAEVTLDAYPDDTFSGQVVRVSPGATTSNGISVFTATVELPNPDGKLRAGMTTEAEIIQSQERGLIVPSKAIETVRTRSYVQVPVAPGGAEGAQGAQGAQDGAGTAGAATERVRVRTGATDGTNTIVTSGLEAGQSVIVPGTTRSTSSSSSSSSSSAGTSSGSRSQTPGGFGGPPPGGFP